MPGGYPLSPEYANGVSVGAVTASSTGTTLTSNSSANTPGAWAQLIAKTTYDAVGFVAFYWPTNNSGSNQAFDIGVGSAGNEKILVPTVALFTNTGNGVSKSAFIPIPIPAGTRVSGRVQDTNVGSESSWLNLILYDAGFVAVEGFAGVECVGYNSGTTLGTTVTGSGSTNTKGSYAQLTAATQHDWAGFFYIFSQLPTTTGTGNEVLFDIAIGSGGNEVVIVPNGTSYISGTNPIFDISPILWIPIPAGTRISARLQSTVASLVGSCTVYGIYL